MKMKAYNIIFPFWFIWLLPPVVLIALTGNFIIDSLVILIAFHIFKVTELTHLSLKALYTKSILKVWGYGFLADFIGVLLLIAVSFLPIPDPVAGAVFFNPFTNFLGFLIILAGVGLASFLIYLFNFHFTFQKIIEEKALRGKVSLTLAIVTAPWTFLLPTQWYYQWFNWG